MQKADPLIRTKLRLPIIRPGLVNRPRLQEQIARGLCGPLTLIAAPAGFGKTTLVAASVAGSGIPVAWLSLDKSDNQPGRFLAYLIAALQVANADREIGANQEIGADQEIGAHRQTGASREIGREAAQLITGLQQASPEAVLTSLINDLDAASVGMILVLDDYQFISSQAVHEEMAFLLDHCPSTLHLLMATRSDPPLPVARLRARGQLIELRAADLRFTPAEASLFLNNVIGLHLDAETIAALEERTEGWIAGLQMAAIAMQSAITSQSSITMQPTIHQSKYNDVSGFLKGFSGTNRYILDYLLEEVLAHQPPETQQFLLYTSILDRLTAPLCDAVLALPDVPNDEKLEPRGKSWEIHPRSPSARQLAYLERENLFLVALDYSGSGAAADAGGTGAGWFRYHHLFADLLKARLQQSQPDLVSQLHIRASAWLEQKSFIPEAIQHLFAAQEMDRAADLIERYGPAHLAESDYSVLQMAGSLPDEMLIARPKIGIYLAWLFINQGLIEKALPVLRDLARQLASANSNLEQQWIYTVVRLALAFLAPPPKPPQFEPLPDYQLLDEIPASEKIMRNAADILYGMTLGRRGETDLAAEFSLKCLQKEKAFDVAVAGQAEAIPTLVPFLAAIYWFQGRLHAAASLCQEYLEPFKEKGIRIFTAGNLEVILGEVLHDWNRLEEAEKQVRDGLQTNEPWANIMTDALGLLTLTHILCDKGDYAGAMQVVEKFETRLQGPLRPVEFREDFNTLRVYVQLASGDLQAAATWADQIGFSEDYQRHPKLYRTILARIRLAQGRYADVEELLAGKSTQGLAGNRVLRQLEAELLLAAAISAQDQPAAQAQLASKAQPAAKARLPEAFKILETCLALAEQEGYISIFPSIGEPLRNLLVAYLRSPAPQHKLFAQKVLEAFSPAMKTAAPAPDMAGLVEPLSARELEVLQLMALGRTNQEIARQFIVALGTIKAHAANIYRKLDAANRTEAVARARQLGLLP